MRYGTPSWMSVEIYLGARGGLGGSLLPKRGGGGGGGGVGGRTPPPTPPPPPPPLKTQTNINPYVFLIDVIN